MTEDHSLEALLALDGCAYEAAAGYRVEFTVRRIAPSPQYPQGIRYALVFRPVTGGTPYVKFDNAHPVPHRGGRHVPPPAAHDHWHRTATDPGRPYVYTTAAQLLEDFWREVKRDMTERGIPNDL